MSWDRDDMTEWRLNNADHISAYSKRYRASRTQFQIEVTRERDRLRSAKKREADRDGYNKRLREWYANNTERALEKNNRWRRANPEKVRAARARRRAKCAHQVNP